MFIYFQHEDLCYKKYSWCSRSRLFGKVGCHMSNFVETEKQTNCPLANVLHRTHYHTAPKFRHLNCNYFNIFPVVVAASASATATDVFIVHTCVLFCKTSPAQHYSLSHSRHSRLHWHLHTLCVCNFQGISQCAFGMECFTCTQRTLTFWAPVRILF